MLPISALLVAQRELLKIVLPMSVQVAILFANLVTALLCQSVLLAIKVLSFKEPLVRCNVKKDTIQILQEFVKDVLPNAELVPLMQSNALLVTLLWH